MKEIWKDIKGYEGLYKASNLGNIKSLKKRMGCGKGYLTKERILKPGKCRGYLQVVLCKNSQQKASFVHRLVAKTFIDNPKTLPMTHHKDRNRGNNNFNNLEWVTQKRNRQLTVEGGFHAMGEKISLSKLKDDDIKFIRRATSNPKWSIKEIAEFTGVTKGNIYKIRNRKLWKHIK